MGDNEYQEIPYEDFAHVISTLFKEKDIKTFVKLRLELENYLSVYDNEEDDTYRVLNMARSICVGIHESMTNDYYHRPLGALNVFKKQPPYFWVIYFFEQGVRDKEKARRATKELTFIKKERRGKKLKKEKDYWT